MKKIVSSFLSLCLILSAGVEASSDAKPVLAPDGYQLKQVVMVSRHGLRAPLATGGSLLARSSAHQFPAWETKGSWLTPKGEILEAYFGKYIHSWMVDRNLYPKDTCPKAEEITVYTNSKQRTIATGEFLAAGMFPGCNVPVENRESLGAMDYTFSPVVRDGSEQFKHNALKAMVESINDKGIQGMNDELKPAYDLLSKIVDFKNSESCKQDGKCDLYGIPTTLKVANNKEPEVRGPVRIGTVISDAFILQYYDGYPMKDVAWGKLTNDQDWLKIAKIKDAYGELLFGAPYVARHVAKPLIDYIDKTLKEDSEKKVVALVGHDSNVVSLLSALDVKPYTLTNTFENTPIGGKIFIEHWTSPAGKEVVKLEYVYQSAEQVRDLLPLTRSAPAQHVALEMKGCKADDNGFYSLDDFKAKLASLKK
ncbi:Glucose-1-phosphatase [invertebrate metagenome]|uniref:Glucose-1-phosphatase n=1 Tax=invertebrate metagenome TaxID=1711999 RepID=A0A2H9T2L4_9ZZZZ